MTECTLWTGHAPPLT